ncbi:MAG: ABC transporter substrate-binding protein [Rhodocyclaceae bacterium]|jgi:branched-chain amino acid transport system substrate-binding protein|nr:ABC transporter substrate-binding protein [Rhodocyclaceae bacterium]MCO5096667.1 ABC transporter substrate-binding protein [Rhodocyclaceae bacterium]
MKLRTALTGIALVAFAATAAADLVVGVTVSTTGPGASLGVHYRNTFNMLPKTLGGQPVKYIVLDDASDPTQAVKNARKLITEENADIILGSSSVPNNHAISEVASELKTVQIALAPMGLPPEKMVWTFVVPQSIQLMIEGVVKHMQASGVKSVGYIGFNDPWGEGIYKALAALAEPAGIKIVANERYARPDTTVEAQVLKIMAAKPDAVLIGGSGTPGALPAISLAGRGFKGPVYGNHGMVNPDFIRIGAKSVEGLIAPTGPLVVVEQLPDSNPVKSVASAFVKSYDAAYGVQNRNAFAGYAYDAYLLIEKALPEAMKSAKPGTPAFRAALRDALEKLHEVVGTHGVYTMSPGNHNGMDARARVLVKVDNGAWKLAQ